MCECARIEQIIRWKTLHVCMYVLEGLPTYHMLLLMPKRPTSIQIHSHTRIQEDKPCIHIRINASRGREPHGDFLLLYIASR
jgi:hypothetical protein